MQQIVADGRQVWLYDPDLKQVSVQNQESALQGSPALLLISGDPVENSFEVIDIGRRQNMDWVELIPKDDGEPVYPDTAGVCRWRSAAHGDGR